MLRFLPLFYQTAPLSPLLGLCLLLSLASWQGVWHESRASQQTGPILFWYQDALYTIDPDGTNLSYITPALQADQRFVEVSPGCHGIVEADCWVLVGHVLYHLSGYSEPLPLPKNQAWVNARASWSPDGVRLVYPVINQTTGVRNLFMYDTVGRVVWQVAETVDDSIKPAWSPGCRLSIFNNCILAYAQKPVLGQKGSHIASLDLATGETQVKIVSSAVGSSLIWSKDSHLYYGHLNWYSVDNGKPIIEVVQTPFAASLSPDATHIVYVANDWEQSGSCSHCNQQLLIAKIGVDSDSSNEASSDEVSNQVALIYTESDSIDKIGFVSDPFWSPSGDTFAIFRHGRLLQYQVEESIIKAWFETQTIQGLGSYAFSLSNDRVALVEQIYLDNPEKPVYRLLVVGATGRVVTLQRRTSSPIIVLAWLPQPISKKKPHLRLHGYWQ